MANTPQPQRQDEPAVTDADLDALLAGGAGAIPGLRPVADVLAALTAAPTAGELAGQARTLAEFRRRAGAPVPRQRARRGTAKLPSRLGTKIGAAAAAAAIVLGGAATAAFANALPAPIQRLAHDAFGAPTPKPGRDLPGHGGPSAPGERAHGQAAAHGERGEPRGGWPARPHATAAPTPPGNPHPKGQQGNPHPKGQQGNPHGHGKHGKPSGQGNQGNGQGNQGNGKGNQGNGKGNQGNEQGGNGHAAAQHGNSQGKGPRGGPAQHRPAGTRAGPHIPKPAMDP